jgi:hypothetical protein
MGRCALCQSMTLKHKNTFSASDQRFLAALRIFTNNSPTVPYRTKNNGTQVDREATLQYPCYQGFIYRETDYADTTDTQVPPNKEGS